MAAQGLKELAGSKAPKFGHFIVEFATPGIGHILKSAGCDFVLFDLEHSGFGFETVKSAIRYFEAADLPVIVRVPSKEYHHIARAMDMGAEGLMLPMVGNVGEARHILNSMKYTPDGGRGVALQVSHDRYRPGTVVDKFTAANRRSTFFVRLRPPKASRMRMQSQPCRGSIACGWATLICPSRLGFRANSTRRNSPMRLLASALPPASMENRLGAWSRRCNRG
jgi:2-keto-3-deoxy-L-rhamnonate aldolase RhmA